MLLKAASRPNHTSYRKFWTNEFVANVLRDNMGSKKISLQPQKKKKRPFFWKKKIQIGISTSKFLIWKKKFSFSPQKFKLELCISNGSEVLIYLSFLLFHKKWIPRMIKRIIYTIKHVIWPEFQLLWCNFNQIIGSAY